MAKPLPVEIPSDDCTVTIDGTTYTPHEGESVTLFPGMSVGAMNSFNELISYQPQLDAAAGEPNEALRQSKIANDAMQALCRALAPRIVSWTWTDMAGRLLPQPDGTPGPLQALESEEVAWLIRAARGETPSARKNGLRPSPITSSATGPRPSRKSSGGGRSQRKR